MLLDSDEGPMFAASYDYLRERGIYIARGLRAGALEVLGLYRSREGLVHSFALKSPRPHAPAT